MPIHDSPEVKAFLNTNLDSIIKVKQLGDKSFAEVEPLLDDIYTKIAEMIKISEQEAYPINIYSNILGYVSSFNGIADQMKVYSIDNDNNFQIRINILNSVKNWHSNIYSGINKEQYDRAENFLLTYNFISFKKYDRLKDFNYEIDKAVLHLQNSQKDVDTVLNLLREKASSKTAEDYAVIFQNESLRHSNFSIQSLKKIKLGAAEVWLTFAIVMVGIFFYGSLHIKDYIPLEDKTNATVIAFQMITRVLIISFMIFLITFCFKQFSIQKHLSSVNTHRQNTLNSFKLLFESIDKEDVATRNTLMMTVAKAIYDYGDSGYINNKDGDNSSSFVEMTKYVTQAKTP